MLRSRTGGLAVVLAVVSDGDDPDLCLGEVDRGAGSDLPPAPAIDLAVHPHLAILDQGPGLCAVIGDSSQLQQLTEPDHLAGDGKFDGVAHLVAVAQLAAGKPGEGTYVATRSYSVMAPHTP